MKALIFISCFIVFYALAGTGYAAAEKTCYKVSAMRYQNNGAYTVKRFLIMYKNNNDEKKSTKGIDFAIYPSQTYVATIDEDSGPPKGNEVWGKVQIESGETEGCRKDGTQFYFRKGGGTVGYKTAGSTYNNNRCQITSRPTDDHLIDCP
jgi:hypothetical protein